MQLQVNGESRHVEASLDAAALLRTLGIGEDGVAVLVNGGLVPRSALASTVLDEGDQVEVVRMVGGG